ncbi:MAG: thermonuclease family protein [Colwellia sp.]|nr:thermonuclease family protein [Colwellia sp.]
MLRSISITLTLTLLSFGLTAKDIKYGDAIVSEITSIYDGDNFRANIKGYPSIIGEHMSIRINGIDTPELRGKCDKEKQLARKAKQFTVEHLRNAKIITLNNIKRGKYFRLIADVLVDGVNLGDLLIKNNHAVKYKGKTKKFWC